MTKAFPVHCLALAACAALAACGSAPDNSAVAIDGDNGATAAAPASIETLPADEGGTPADSANAAVEENGTGASVAEGGAPAIAIPAAMQGRWGMVKNDCDPAYAAAAKGLIRVSAGDIRFYESVGTLTVPQTVTASKFVGRFAFSGEGMKWEKVETLRLDGKTLTRSDDEGTTRYERCA